MKVYTWPPAKRKKLAIPKRVRDLLWVSSFGETFTGNCSLCAEDVTVHNFHAGHLISEANGGGTELDNLTVLCAACNTSMSSQNFDEFAERTNILSRFKHHPEQCKCNQCQTINTFLSNLK